MTVHRLLHHRCKLFFGMDDVGPLGALDWGMGNRVSASRVLGETGCYTSLTAANCLMIQLLDDLSEDDLSDDEPTDDPAEDVVGIIPVYNGCRIHSAGREQGLGSSTGAWGETGSWITAWPWPMQQAKPNHTPEPRPKLSTTWPEGMTSTKLLCPYSRELLTGLLPSGP